MLSHTLIAILLGCIIGTFSGIIPGIHINLISVIILGLSPILLQYTSPITLAIFIISMSIIHSFLDFIPSAFLGAPDESTAMSVLPAHRLLLQGRGYEAVKLTVMGSLFCLLLIIGLTPIVINTVSYIYPIIKSSIGYILIIAALFLILREKNSKFWPLMVFIISGILGIALFNLNLKDPLLPMLSGLFGVSTLLLSYNDNTKIPQQNFESEKLSKKEITKATITGTFSSSLCSFLPGIGPAQAAILGSTFARKITDRGFLIMVGGIGTVNMLLSIVGLYVLNKARNGSIVIAQRIIETVNFDTLILFLGVSLLVAGIAVPYTLFLAKQFSKFINIINYKLTCLIVIIFITLLVFYFTSFIGLLILFVATMLGLIAPLIKIGRSHAMGCLILPVILYYIL
mgnify:CR=1 FL=1